MPCAFPIPALKPRAGGRLVFDGREIRDFGERADAALSSLFHLFLPCGSCVGCQLARARSWAVRCSLEQFEHRVSSFVTLTYAPRYVPPSLVKADYSGFVRSLRKRLGSRSVRHFGCGEYGENRGRPHYHAILFGTEDREAIERSWQKGFVTVDKVNPARISYVAGYCAKKLGFWPDPVKDLISSDGELYDYQPPFLQMSRRPGIGGAARRHRMSWRRFAYLDGRQVPVPRFLHSSWRESASESDLADLERERRESRMTLTVSELDASHAIARARVRLSLERSKL